MMQDLSGQKLGQYELRERLGRGGMAEVYKAYQPGMDRFVAVKVMLGHLADDEGFVARFKREAQSVGKLRHPHIVNVFDFGVERDIYYMVMEYIEGANLKHHIQQHHALPLLDSLKIASQIADALDYAHNRNMIHRDLKPANIMFMDKEHRHAVLTDFGIARLLGQSGLTASGAMVGTPAYISPEAARGEDIDERADLYGLGIILYEMITGKVPYDADTPLAVIMKHINAPLPTPRDYGREIPPDVEKIIVKSLTKMPADRYQSAAEMKTAIDNLINNWVEIPEKTAALKTAPALSDEDHTVVDTVGGRTAQRTDVIGSQDTLPPPPRRTMPLMLIGIGVILVALLGLGVFLLGGEDGEKDSQEIAASTVTKLPPSETPSPPTATDTPEPTTVRPSATLEPTTVPPSATVILEPPTEVAVLQNSVEISQVELSTLPRQIEFFPAPEGDFTTETHLTFTPRGDFQGAGFYVELENNSRIEYLLAYCTPNDAGCVGPGVYLDYLGSEGFATLLLHEVAPIETDDVYLRLTRIGTTYMAEYRGLTDWQRLAQFEVPEQTLQIGLVAQSASGEAADNNPNNLPPETVVFHSLVIGPPQSAANSTGLDPLSGLSPLQDEVEGQLMAGNYEVALQRMNDMLDANPDNVEALVARSMLFRRNGDTEAAFADADRAIELAPENPIGYIARADILANWPVWDYAAALQSLETALALSPDNPHILWRLSRVRVELGGAEGLAREEFERAIAHGAKGLDFYFFAGEYLHNSQEYARAEPYLRVVHNSVRYDEFTMLYFAGTLMQLGQFQEAYQVVRDFPWGTDYPWGSPDENWYGDMAVVAFNAGEYEQAREWARRGMALSGDAYKAQHVMGLVSWYADENLEQALAYLDPLLDVGYYGWPFLSIEFGHTAQLDRARIFAAAGDAESALDAYTLALEQNGEWPVILEERANVYLSLDNAEAALVDLRMAFLVSGYGNVDPDKRNRLKQRVVETFWGEEADNVINPPVSIRLTEADLTIPILSGLNPVMDEFDPLFLHEANDLTLEIINNRLEAEPDNPELLAARVMVYIEMDQIEPARADADRIIELAPDDPLGYLMRVHIGMHWSVDDPEEVLENSQKAFELAPENPEVLWRLAWSYWRNGDVDSAATYFDQAQETGARGFRYALEAGTFWYETEQYDRAIEPLKTFYVAQPHNLYYGSFLLGALIQTGQAETAYQIATSMAPYADDETSSYAGLAYAAFRAGQYEQAKAWLQVASAFSVEDFYQARYLLALLKWYGDRDLNGAMEMFDSLEGVYYQGGFIDIRFGHHILIDRARIYKDAEMYEASIEAWTAAIESEFSYAPQIYEERADVYLLLGNRDAAREDLRRAVELTEDDAERERLLQRILELDQ